MRKLIGVIVADRKEQIEIEKKVKSYPFNFQIYSSLQELVDFGLKERFTGFVLDFRTMLGLSQQERDLAANLEDFFPILRLVRHQSTGSYTGFTGDKIFEEEEAFRYFFEKRCAHFEPRGVRRHLRRNIHFAVRVGHQPVHGPSDGFAANSIDLSENGMFVMSMQPLEKEASVYLLLCDLPKSDPIHAQVQWQIGWNKLRGHLPGFGVRFLEVGERERAFMLECLETGSILEATTEDLLQSLGEHKKSS